MTKKPLVVNFFGGPGSGKSTAAAALFAALKERGIRCELVTEFAKDMTWEGNELALSVQPYIFGNQYYRMVRCADKVDVLITDSPLLLCVVHNKDERCGPELDATVTAAFHSFNNLSFFLERPEVYECAGREETQEEADDIRESVLRLALQECDVIPVIACNEQRNPVILADVLRRLQEEGILNSSIRN